MLCMAILQTWKEKLAVVEIAEAVWYHVHGICPARNSRVTVASILLGQSMRRNDENEFIGCARVSIAVENFYSELILHNPQTFVNPRFPVEKRMIVVKSDCSRFHVSTSCCILLCLPE